MLASIVFGASGCRTEEGRSGRPEAGLLRLVPLDAARRVRREDLDLANPKNVAIDDRGFVYVADQGPPRLLVFDSLGQFVRTIGRQGQGPGEFESPLVAARKGRILVLDNRLRRLTLFDTGGRLLWTREGSCCREYPPQFDEAGRFFAVSALLAFGAGAPRFHWLISYDSVGNPVDSLAAPSGIPQGSAPWRVVNDRFATEWPVPFAPRSYFAVTPRGRLVYGESDDYLIIEGRDATDTGRRIIGAYERLPIPDSVKLRAIEFDIGSTVRATGGFVDAATLRKAARQSDVPAVYPAFFGLAVDPCGRIWVLRNSGHSGTPATFDVFEEDGSFLGSLTIGVPMLERARWAVGVSRLVAVVEDASGAPSLGVFRVESDTGRCERSAGSA